MTYIFNEMLGQEFKSVYSSQYDEELIFETNEGRIFKFYHKQNCCERVSIEDIIGDLKDLENSKLLVAEEVSSEGKEPELDYVPESYTWTFYKFATRKGNVTVRWFGRSNGYYSEKVSFNDSWDDDAESRYNGW